MQNEFLNDINPVGDFNFREEVIKYFSFWPWFLLSILFFIFSSYIYLRYAEYNFKTTASIEILDESQDSEMALPTALTVFNRSMVNLVNEINLLSSFSLHSIVSKELKSNVRFYTSGNIKTLENHPDQWFDDYDIEFNVDISNVSEYFEYKIEIENNFLNISEFIDGELNKEYNFQTLSTKEKNHNLPFNLSINNIKYQGERTLKIIPLSSSINQFRKYFEVIEFGKDSDQLLITMIHPNKQIAQEYLSRILISFDNDGISDRQLEYKNTIDFVDSRSKILREELEKIEIRKQNFKEKNNLSNIETNAEINIQNQLSYNSELFNTESQKSLAEFLKESVSSGKYEYLPLNIGLDNFDLNMMISEYNQLIRQREKYLSEAGENNSFVKSLENQLDSFVLNITNSIVNYNNSLEIKINNLKDKEKEFSESYNAIPENEKILRTIERELSVKEALFLLLLQKREEASINFAVVKPTIKVIDYPITNPIPASPNSIMIYLASMLVGFSIPFLILYLRFFFDNKVHTKEQLLKKLDKIAVVGEIPFSSNNDELEKIVKVDSRNTIAESIRMVIANLNFILFKDGINENNNNTILVTSTIKGEGKTLLSVNIASLLSKKYKKVLLVGADLRNPQIHKFLNIDKSTVGLSNYMCLDNLNWKDLIIKNESLDILLSGVIPPNPTEILASNKFKSFIEEVKREYDYIIIDSAPCLLVSDTFEISKYVDTTLYVVRSNHTDLKICDFINESKNESKLTNINIILNGVGNSQAYGYKYGYQYGYRYGYKYGYNYGYGYGYGEDKS